MKFYLRLAAAALAAVMTLSACSFVKQPEDDGEEEISQSERIQNENITVKEDAVVTLSQEAGIYGKPFTLEIEAQDAQRIIYTVDGSDPRTSETAAEYDGGIDITNNKTRPNVVSAVPTTEISGNYNKANADRDGFECTMSNPSDRAVDKCTTLKAAAQYKDGSFSPVETATYFVGDAQEHIKGLAESNAATGGSLAVVSISMEYDDLFDNEKGIYVKGDIFDAALEQYREEHNGRIGDAENARSLDANYKQRGGEWERPTHVDFFEFDANGARLAFSQDCGIRIQGNYSRSDLQKGFRLLADKDYGEKHFKYAVFGDSLKDTEGETIEKFKTLVLRAGGNCAFTAKFNDTFWQSLLTETACDTKASRPCVVYLNGEYWGLYVLEEDYSSYFYQSHYGVEKNDVVIYKGDAEKYECGYKLDEGELPEGATDESYFYNSLFGFLNAHKDIASDESYEAFAGIVDPQSVLDYFAAEIWINNKWDWPGKNWSMWKSANVVEGSEYSDGRWRFSFYDMEFGGVSGSSDAGTNTLKEDNYKPLGMLDRNTNNPAVLCFAYLMTNEGFRSSFYDRLRELSANEFEHDAAVRRLEEFEEAYGPLYDQFFDRYPGTGSSNDALKGGYASSRCIRDFLDRRSDNIEKMINWAEKQY